MKCPHCLVAFNERQAGIPDYKSIGEDAHSHWGIHFPLCPTCGHFIIYLEATTNKTPNNGQEKESSQSYEMVYPKGVARSPIPPEVPTNFAADYKEACLVFRDSEKASAALSRRCLQNLLREKARTKKRDLADQIQEILDSKQLPSSLADAIDAIRAIGNFAAHTTKSTNTGEVIEVEPGEAEWLLDTLEGLFDFYFVQPAILKQKRDALNKKLAAAGKPPLKKGKP